jgi:mono/diheme cytochrome c family protein
MKFTIAAAVIALGWSVGVMQAARPEQAAGAASGAAAAATSTWGGVYSDAQATLGEAAYTKNCAECHGQDLAGDGFAPALKGPEFMSNWNGLTLGDLFERIRVSMPPNNPNAVTPKEKVEIIAYLLKQAAFPVGEADLPPTQDALKTVKFEATKPGIN